MMAEDTPYATVSWTPGDVLTLRPDWPLDRAEDWLDRNGKYIAENMAERGWAGMETLLNEDDTDEGTE